MGLYFNRLNFLSLMMLLFISCELDNGIEDNQIEDNSDGLVFYNHYDGLDYTLSVYLEFLNEVDNIDSIKGKIQNSDLLLYEFNLSNLDINPNVFIYEGILLDEYNQPILSDSTVYLYDMIINILFIDGTNYTFHSDLTTPIAPTIIDYDIPETFELDSTEWKQLSIDLEVKDLNGFNNIESVEYQIKTSLLNGCQGDCIIDDNCNEDIISEEYASDDTWVFDYIESKNDTTFIYNEIIFMRPLDGSALHDSEGNIIYESSDCGRTGIVEFKFIVKDKDGLSTEIDEIIMEITE